MKAAIACATGAALLLHALPSHACAGCRNPSLAVGRASDGPLEAHDLKLGATLTGTTVHVVHEAGCPDLANCDEVPVQPLYLHDQRMVPLELRITGEYSFTDTLGVELQLPARLVTTTIEYTTPDGDHYEPLDQGVHHRDETVAGLGDPWALLRIGTVLRGWFLAARPGLTLPLGKTEEDPFQLGDQGLRHQHIQLGTGTFDPVLVLEASRAFEAVRLGFFAQGQMSLYENSHGYRGPFKLYSGASLGTTLIGKLSGSLGPEFSHEGADRWNGVERQDGNLGRSELLAAFTLTQAIDATQLSLGVRLPLWRHIVVGDEPPGTLSSPVTAFLSVTYVLHAYED